MADDKKLKSFLKDLRKTTESNTFDSSAYGEIDHWISTGDYGLNRIISGDIYKGIPSGKVILLGGESGSGKSLVSAQIAANALHEHDYDIIFYFDSEGGAMKEFFESRGCDASKIEQILVDSVEDAALKILSTYKKIEAFKKEETTFKALLILDSLGALVATKFISDAEKGKMVSDMGGRAKIVNNMIKGLTIPALKSDCSIIIVNHIYDDPSSMFPSKIKKQGGGRGIQYMARISLQCTKSYEKDGDSDAAYKAVVLKFMTTKNSIVKPFQPTEMYLDFSKGPNKYFGLFKPALDWGFIVKPSNGFYQVPSYSDKKMRLKELFDGDEIWESFLEEFNAKSKDELSYSGVGTNNDDRIEEILEDIPTEIDETEISDEETE